MLLTPTPLPAAPWLLPLADAAARNRHLAGGKAASLATLLQAGIAVPDGVVVATPAYQYMLAHHLQATALPDWFAPTLQGMLPRSASRQFAVRSSATSEDAARTSYAGVFASFLGVAGSDLIASLVRCWHATRHAIVHAYQQHAAGSTATPHMAVVIQPMLYAQVAGVAFSADPRNGDPTCMPVVLHAGSAEGVVQGTAHIQTLHLHRTHQRIRVPAASPLLNTTRLAELGALVLEIERIQGNPVDVEWCWDGQQFWVLQARPITTLPATGRSTIWSGTNLHEILPDIPTPATWSVLASSLDTALRQVFVQAGYAWHTDTPAVSNIAGRGYLNMSQLSQAAHTVYGINPADLATTLGGSHLALLPAAPHTGLATRLRHAVNLTRFGWRSWQMLRRADAHFAQTVQWCAAIRRDVAQQPAAPHTADLMQQVQQRSASFLHLYMQIVFAGVGSTTLRQRLYARAGSTPPPLAAPAASPMVQVAQHITRMAQLAQQHPPTRAWLAAGNWAKWQDDLRDSPLLPHLHAFLAHYGQRVVGQSELELAHPRWHEDPESLFDLLRTPPPARLPTHPTPTARPFWWRLPLGGGDRTAQHMLLLREQAKHTLLHILDAGRMLLLHAGDLLVRGGWLATRDEIFWLDLPTIQAALHGHAELLPTLTARVAAARARASRFACQPAVTVYAGNVPITPTSADRLPHLSGVAAAPGMVEGRARVLRQPTHTPQLQAGDILVCPTTDSTWLLLFLQVAGLVVEIGGLLSHGAIIARELGIPTVTNVNHAMTQISDGQLIRVDGHRGTVTLLGDAATGRAA